MNPSRSRLQTARAFNRPAKDAKPTAAARSEGRERPLQWRWQAPQLRAALALILLSWQPGCGRAGSEASTKQPELSAASPKTELVPLTNMVLIKAGSFLRIKYPVTLTRDFWLGKYEVA